MSEITAECDAAAFRAVPFIAAIGTPHAERLWRRAICRRYEPGEVIRLQDDPAEHLLLLLSGDVSTAVLTASGRTAAAAVLAAPCVIDKVAVLDGGGHTVTVTARSSCVVAAVPARLAMDVVGELPAARSHLFTVLAAQARAQQLRLVLAALAGGERVLGWLAHAAGDPDGRAGRIVPMPGSQGELARQLDISRVTVNRTLRRLERDGIVRNLGDGIEILDRTALERALR